MIGKIQSNVNFYGVTIAQKRGTKRAIAKFENETCAPGSVEKIRAKLDETVGDKEFLMTAKNSKAKSVLAPELFGNVFGATTFLLYDKNGKNWSKKPVIEIQAPYSMNVNADELDALANIVREGI